MQGKKTLGIMEKKEIGLSSHGLGSESLPYSNPRPQRWSPSWHKTKTDFLLKTHALSHKRKKKKKKRSFKIKDVILNEKRNKPELT